MRQSSIRYMLPNDQRMTRNGNVEALRCLLMFLIVAYHSFIYGPCSNSKDLWTYCFTVLICWHVDGFLAISGWYGIKFRWRRFVGLIGQFAFYGVLSCVYCWIAGKNLHGVIYSFTGGWFGASYLVLMLLAPWINRFFETEGIPRLHFALVGLCAVVLFASWITGRFGEGMVPIKGFGVHAVLLMVYLYCTARFLRMKLEGRSPRRWVLFGCMGIFALALPIFRIVDILHWQMTGSEIVGIGAYFAAFDAPHTVLMAFSLLLLFVYHVRLPSWFGNFATRLAPYLFGIYLCHVTTTFGGRFYALEDWLVNTARLHGFIAVILTAMFIFAIGVGVEFARRNCLNWICGLKGRTVL